MEKFKKNIKFLALNVVILTIIEENLAFFHFEDLVFVETAYRQIWPFLLLWFVVSY